VKKLGDGPHLQQKKKKKKEKKKKKNKGEQKLSFCQDLVMAPTYAPQKKPKEGKRRGAQASFLLRLGHGALEATKQMKKGGASSLSAKSWQWHLRSSKKFGGGEQVPLLSRVGDGVAKSTKK